MGGQNTSDSFRTAFWFSSCTDSTSDIIMVRSGDPADKPYGNGVLLWFEIHDFDAAVTRAVEMKADIFRPRHRNPPTGGGGPSHGECWSRDPDGYIVVLANPDGSAG
jgi:hypothetical protein